MKEAKYLLSICIPTYNRCEYLKKSLESIIKQQPFIKGKIEVVISDNASTDNTEAVAEEYTAKYAHIKYFKNDENIYDKNFPLVLSRASGVLRRLSNDTLIYEDGALEYLCELSQRNSHDRPVIFLGLGNLHGQKHIVSFREAVQEISYWPNYNACFTLWDEDCDGIERDTSDCDLKLWQAGKFYQLASQKGYVLIDDTKIDTVQFIKNKDISYGIFHVFYENYLLIVKRLLSSALITQSLFEYLERDLLFNFFIGWTLRWEVGVKNLNYSKEENLKELVFTVAQKKPYWRQFKRCYSRRKFVWRLKQPLRFIKHRIFQL